MKEEESNPASEILARGTLTLQGQFTLGSNYTFLVEAALEGESCLAVYKPQKGEQPLWDFPANSLAGREVSAYRLSEFLGWNLVPLTLFRADAPLGPGSLQQYIEYNPNYHYFNFRPADKEKLRPVALFDHLSNNADRKGSHVFFQKRSHRLYAIDHGLCFHAEDKLRTVIWDFGGEPIPTELLPGLQALSQNPPDFLAEWLQPEEISALLIRARRLLAEKIFPPPPAERRAFPYPPL